MIAHLNSSEQYRVFRPQDVSQYLNRHTDYVMMFTEAPQGAEQCQTAERDPHSWLPQETGTKFVAVIGKPPFSIGGKEVGDSSANLPQYIRRSDGSWKPIEGTTMKFYEVVVAMSEEDGSKTFTLTKTNTIDEENDESSNSNHPTTHPTNQEEEF